MQLRHPPENLPELELTIDAMAYGGKGVARHDGKVYFIADAIDGDIVRARVTADNGRYGEAEITALVRPSPRRQPPRCPYAATCGGCQWMGVDYEQQLAWKQAFVASSLTRIGKLPDTVAVRITPSPTLYGYRNRVLMRAHLDQQGVLRVGYFRRGTRELVPVDACLSAAPALNRVLAGLLATDWQAVAPLKLRFELQEIPAVDGRDVVVTVHPAEGPRDAVEAFVERLRALPTVHWAGLVFALSEAPTVAFDEDLGIGFRTIPGQFQQVNLEHNRTLRRLIKEKVDQVAPRRILDLHCGSGNLSLPLASDGRYIEGIEVNKKAIVMARRNAEANGLRNVTYLAGDAEKHLWKVARGGESFDLVILDPPRQGMYKGMVPLRNLAPDHIIYVSCDPTTLARDLGYLTRKDTYLVEAVTALDFFPNTYHVETVAFLRRNQ